MRLHVMLRSNPAHNYTIDISAYR